VSDKHIRGEKDGTRGHRDPALGIDFGLLLAKCSRRRGKAVERQMASEVKYRGEPCKRCADTFDLCAVEPQRAHHLSETGFLREPCKAGFAYK